MTIRIYVGDCRDVLRTLPSGSVHTTITSPPYWGLRNYSTEPQVWGGDVDCEHEWGDSLPPAKKSHTNEGFAERVGSQYRGGGHKADTSTLGQRPSNAGTFCQRCSAWRGSLGLEPTPELYVEHLVKIFREMKRVLRDDGVVFLNLGDSYAGAKTDKPHTGGLREPGKYGHGGGEKPISRTANKLMPIGLKPKDLCGIPWRVAFALQADGWWLRSDIIWNKPNCLSGGVRVYAWTQKGIMPMTIKDMVRLDPSTVKLWNGEKWTQAIAWMENPRPDDPIEIELRSGEKIGCTPDHLWPTQRGNIRADKLLIGDAIEYAKLPDPSNTAPEMLPSYIIGNFVGLFIAEGSYSGHCIQISSHIKETDRVAFLERFAQYYDGSCAVHKTGENQVTINLHGATLRGILSDYVVGKCAKGKHLTTKAWQRSDTFLMGVLDGYLKGDGHHDKNNDRWRIGFTRNYAWANDLRTICARLDIQLRLKPTFSIETKTGKRHPSYKGEIRFERSTHFNAKSDTEIVRIGRSKGRKFWDIAVEDEPHLFALASGVLTHNCMPESVTDRPTKSHEYIFLLTKSARYFYDADAIREPFSLTSHPNSSGGQFSQVHNGDSKITGHQQGRAREIEQKGKVTIDTQPNPAGRNRRTVWTVPTQPYSGAHFATFPPALVEPMVKAGTSERGCCAACGSPWERVVEKHNPRTSKQYRERQTTPKDEAAHGMGGRGTYSSGLAKPAWRKDGHATCETVGWQPTCACGVEDVVSCVCLDPFAGAGTVGLVADRLQRDAILIELNPEYAEMARRRIEGEAPMFSSVVVERV